VKVAYLSQSLQLDQTKTVIQTLIAHEHELGQLVMRYEQACADPMTPHDTMEQLLHEIEEKNARAFETMVKTIIAKLQLQKLLNQPL